MKNSSGRNMPEYDGGITPTGTSEVIYIIGELEIMSNRFKLQNMLIIISL